MAFSLGVRVEFAYAANPLSDPTGWSWTDESVYALTSGDGSPWDITIKRGRPDENQEVQFATATLRLNNSDGRFTPHHPSSPRYPNVHLGLPVRISVNPGSGWNVRFVGFIDGWRPRWPGGSGISFAEVQVSASGILRRLVNTATLRSAFVRALTLQPYTGAPQAIAYWPCEDASGSPTIAPGITGGIPATYTGTVNLGADSNVDGSGPLLKLTTGATVEFTVDPRSSGTPWAVRFLCRLPNNVMTDKTALVTIRTPLQPIDTWDLTIRTGSPDKLQLFGYHNGADQISDAGVNFTINGTEPYGDQLWVEINTVQSGPDINWSYTVRSKNGSVSNSGTKVSAFLSGIRSIGLNGPSGVVSDLNGATFGHMAVANSASYGLIGTLGAGGWVGEMANDRFSRLCDEQGVSAAVETAAGDVVYAMGPQGAKAFLDLLRECEAADGGELRESRTTAGLVYRTRFQRYNRAADLTLDINQGHVLDEAWEPIEDDQRTVNDQTVARQASGTTAQYVDADHQSRYGLYTPPSVTLNLAEDHGLVNHAEWRVNLGTIEEMRLPAVAWDLASNPGLVASWLACDLGSRIALKHPPRQYGPDDLDLTLEGYEEKFSILQWRVTGSVSPYRPWEVFKIEDSRLGRLGSDGSTLSSSVTTTATSLSVAVNSGPLWVTGAQNFDLDLEGERCTVTNISGSSSPQTFTVTRSVNGIQKTHSSGAVVNLWRPGAIAL